MVDLRNLSAVQTISPDPLSQQHNISGLAFSPGVGATMQQAVCTLKLALHLSQLASSVSHPCRSLVRLQYAMLAVLSGATVAAGRE